MNLSLRFVGLFSNICSMQENSPLPRLEWLSRFVSWLRDISPSPDAKQTPQSASRYQQAIFALLVDSSFPHVLQTGILHVIKAVVHYIALFGISVFDLAVWTLPLPAKSHQPRLSSPALYFTFHKRQTFPWHFHEASLLH